MKKHRIWELDAFRGICILGMVFVHLMYDLAELYGIIDWEYPLWFDIMKNWGGVLFVLLSGICATLGRRSVRRGLIVLAGGLIVSAATWGMYKFFHFHKSIIIYFGVLHCLGACMILWWLCKRLPTWILGLLGGAMVAAGLYLGTIYPADNLYWIWLGVIPRGFMTSDFFPLLPNLGYFLLGAVIGRMLYRKKETLFPRANPKNFLIVGLSFLGRHSLEVYLLHQPILAGICMLLQK